MSNVQGVSHEAQKAVTPSETKPAPQQNQGDSKPGASKPQQHK